MDNLQEIMDVLGKVLLRRVRSKINSVTELNQVADRDIDKLSGGELQRFAIGIVCVQKADVYVHDNPFAGELLTFIKLHVRRAIFIS